MSKSLNYTIMCISLISLISCDRNTIVQSGGNGYESISMVCGQPYSVLDNNNFPIILWGQDTVSTYLPELFKTDGELDNYYLTKYDFSGKTIIDSKSIISSNAAMSLRAFVRNNLIYIVWLDARNNPNFKASYHPYLVDIYYKTIDFAGNIITKDTRLTNELINEYEAYSSYSLEKINMTTLKDIGKYDVFSDHAKGLFLNKSFFIYNQQNEELHLKLFGGHMADSCYLSYSKLKVDSTIIISEKKLIKFTKVSGLQWGPSIQNLFFHLDITGILHISWQLNDGKNNFYYYYMIINQDGNIEYCNIVGKKYKNSI